MPAKATVPQSAVIRGVRLRLLPESKSVACHLAGQAGACRWLWNHLLAQKQDAYRQWQENPENPKPCLSFYALGKEFTALRNDPAHAWL